MAITVFVTGATSSVGQHLIQLLLSKKYHVVGTMRTIEQGNQFQKLFGSKNFTYELVKSVGSTNAYDNALKRHPEITVLIHTELPETIKGQDPETDILIPAVESMTNMLSAVKCFGLQIEHVVVTSSVVAHLDPEKMNDPNHAICEDSWSPITWEHAKASPELAFFGSKTFSEQVAWDFYETEKPKFTFNVVSPAYIFGPQAFDLAFEEKLDFSAEIINKFLNLTPDSEVPFIIGGFVDVRDVSKAYVAAFEGNFSKRRLLLSSEVFNGQILLDILREHFYSLRDHLPIGDLGQRKELIERSFKIINTETKDILGFSFIDLQTSVVDSMTQILKAHKKEYCPPGMFLQKEHRVFRGPTTFE